MTVYYVNPNDDLKAIYDSIPEGAGHICHVNTGSYVLNSTGGWTPRTLAPKSAVTLRGDGKGKSIIKFYATPAIAQQYRYDMIMSTAPFSNFNIEDLTLDYGADPATIFDPNYPASGYGNIFSTRGGVGTSCAVRRVEMKNAFAACYGAKLDNSIIEDCSARDCWTGYAINSSNDTVVQRCSAIHTRGDGIFTQGQCTNIEVNNCYAEDVADVGIDVTGQLSLGYRHNTIKVHNNRLLRAIIRVSGADYVELVGNRIDHGVISVDAGQGVPTNIVIKRNGVYEFDKNGDGAPFAQGIWCQGTNVVIGGDDIADGNNIYGTLNGSQWAVGSSQILRSPSASLLIKNNYLTVPMKTGNAAIFNGTGVTDPNFPYVPPTSAIPLLLLMGAATVLAWRIS